jgi:hypothetical protein
MGQVAQQSPKPKLVKIGFIKLVLNKKSWVGIAQQIPKPLGRKDKLDLYLKEPSRANIGVIKY